MVREEWNHAVPDEEYERINKLEAEVSTLKQQAGIATWVTRTLAGGAMVAIVWLVHGIWDRSALEERAKMKLEILEERVKTVEVRLESHLNQGINRDTFSHP